MSTRRLYYALGAIALAALLTLAGRAVLRAGAPQRTDSLAFPPRPRFSAVQSAAQSREALSREIEALQNAPVDSGTRSYMAWAKAVEEQQNGQIDSGTRSYMAWAKYIEEQQKAARPTTAP